MKKLGILLLGCSIATGVHAFEFVKMATFLAAPIAFGLSKDGYKYFKATYNLEKNVDDVLNGNFVKRITRVPSEENTVQSIEKYHNQFNFGISEFCSSRHWLGSVNQKFLT